MLSVIIPVYNVEKYLRRCLDSVINQTYKDLEIICVNDGSTDSSLSILKEYERKDKRIVIINKENGGLPSAWNAGLNAVGAEYVTFVDSDDWVEKDTFELAYNAITQNNVDYVYWSANIVWEYKNAIHEKHLEKYFSLKYSGVTPALKNIIENTPVTVWSKLYKTQILKDNDILFHTTSGHADCLFWAMYAPYAQKGYYINKKLYNYVQRENSITGSRYTEKTNETFAYVVMIPILINYYNKHNLTTKYIDFLIDNIKTLFYLDYNYKDKKYCNKVLSKVSDDLKNTDLGILKNNAFITNILNKKIVEKKQNYSILERFFSLKNNNQHKILCFLGLRFKFKRKKNDLKKIQLRLNDFEKKEIYESGLYDGKYYLTQVQDDSLNKYTGIEHYLKQGWKNGYNPSALFDGVSYVCRYNIKENPLLHYLHKGRFAYNDPYLYNVYGYDIDSIREYNEYKDKRKNSKVIYTCITNDYDDLEDIQGYKYIAQDWDYICFTDNEKLIQKKQIGIWQIRPLAYHQMDNTRNNRWHKINPNLILPEYEESIYIDANINILTNKLFNLIEQNPKKDLILPCHANTDCLYKEFQWVLNDKIDKQEIMEAHLDLLKKEGFPKYYGMPENNVIYRKHSNPKIINIMNDWWYMLEHYTKRDQLSLAYILWKHNIQTDDVICFPNTRIDYKNFCTFIHRGKR